MDHATIAKVSVGRDSFQTADKFSSGSAQCEPRILDSLIGERRPVVRSLEGDDDNFLHWVHSYVTTSSRTVIGTAERVSRGL